MAGLPKEKRQKQKPVNDFYVFKKPMVAEGREDTLLGVAFESPREGTLGRYTPQGPGEDTGIVASLSALGKGFSGWTKIGAPEDDPEQATAGAAPNGQPAHPIQQQPAQNKTFYSSPCKWPKDLVKRIYPNKPTIAIGVEACLENVKEGTLSGKILDIIAMGLKVKTSELDKVIVPVVRRYSTEDPWGKIYDLLHVPEYRARVKQLFSFQKPGKKNILWVATSLVACGGLSYDRVKEAEQELSLDAKDPTKTVPAKIGGKLHHVKHSALKGEYESDVVIMMSYRRIRYECVRPEAGGGWWGWPTFKGQRQNSIDEQAIPFEGDNGAKDLFWIDKNEAEKGDVPAWIGEETPVGSFMSEARTFQEEPPAIFENASFADATAGADEETDEERLPDGFFDQSGSDEE